MDKITLLRAGAPSRIVLFAVGNGGDPERHLPLLSLLNEHGCTVVAPHFDRLASPRPTEEELLTRALRLRQALDSVARPNIPVVGIGHSIGSTILIALAGGQMWLGPGRPVRTGRDERIGRLVLMTPATGFFQVPGALASVSTPILAWAGTEDPITPPAQSNFLKLSLENRVPVEVRIVEGAGHFSFMNTLPPQVTDTLPDRENFLAHFAGEVRAWAFA